MRLQPHRDGGVEHYVGAVGAHQLHHRDVQLFDDLAVAVQDRRREVAYASCDACGAFAGAIEVVFVPADKASTIAPTNLAVAVNEDCTSCESVA